MARTKAKTKAQELREKRERKKAMASQLDAKPETIRRPPVSAPPRPKVEAIRPTAERMAKGRFRMPSGRGMQSMPAVDEAHDAIAKLSRAGLITACQEAAARDWQEFKAAIRAELGISQGRSCLDMSPAGHDDSEGDSDLLRRWFEVEAELGSFKTGALDYTCVMGHPPANLPLLRAALDAFADC